jgi:hypothetical protein
VPLLQRLLCKNSPDSLFPYLTLRHTAPFFTNQWTAEVKLTHLDRFDEYKQDGLYKYSVGDFENDFNAANNYKNDLREMGFKHAFVVAFQNGERISLENAIKLAKEFSN